jgi:hypothetical protein
MANEGTISAAMRFVKSGTDTSIEKGSFQFDVGGTNFVRHRQTVGTSSEALKIGEVAPGGYVLFINRGTDASDYIELRTLVGQNPFAQLFAGDVALFRYDVGVTAPVAIAVDGAMDLDYLLLDL